MFQNILLPLDGSHFSELALPLAVQIARTAAARLHIVRVHVPTATTGNLTVQWNLDELVREQEREHLTASLERARAAGATVSAELLEGAVAPALERYSEAVAIDLVVMTTHGRSGLSRAVLGSVAAQCVRTTNVPVLLLHPREGDDAVLNGTESLKRILVALDGTPESESILGAVVDLATLTAADLMLVCVATAPFDIAATLGYEALQEYLGNARRQAEDYLEGVADRWRDHVPVSTLAVSASRAAAGILRCQEETGADLVAMATSGRSGWARVAIGSVAESVLHKATAPVLLLRPAAFTGRDVVTSVMEAAAST